jgi:hypothetical protein
MVEMKMMRRFIMLQQEIAKRELPPLLTMKDGRPCTADLWRERRAELLDILQKYIYDLTAGTKNSTLTDP